MLTKLIGIGSNTFRETIRQPIYGLLLAVAIGLLVLNPMLAAYTLDDDNKFMLEIGLSTLLLTGLFLAAFGAARGMAVEIENRTALTVLSKPVSRTTFLVGKFAGLAAAVTLGLYLCTLVFLFTVRHKVMQTAATPFDQPVMVFGVGLGLASLVVAAAVNYLTNAHFPTAAMAIGTPALTVGILLTGLWDGKWQLNAAYGQGVGASVLAAVALVWLAALLLAAIALAASTRLRQAATLGVTVAALVVGLGNDSFFGTRSGLATGIVPTVTSQPTSNPWELATTPAADVAAARAGLGQPAESPLARAFYSVCYRVLPNFNFYWTSDALLQDAVVPFSYVGRVGLYTLAYVAAVLAVGVALFQTREVS